MVVLADSEPPPPPPPHDTRINKEYITVSQRFIF
jgi:hypothetical protein